MLVGTKSKYTSTAAFFLSPNSAGSNLTGSVGPMASKRFVLACWARTGITAQHNTTADNPKANHLVET